jgi:hypothetical protein
MAVVYPKFGDEKRIAQVLLALADSVYDVRTSSDEGLAFVIPDELHAKFVAHESGLAEPEPVANTDLVKRRPGRPRKVAEPVEEGSD